MSKKARLQEDFRQKKIELNEAVQLKMISQEFSEGDKRELHKRFEAVQCKCIENWVSINPQSMDAETYRCAVAVERRLYLAMGVLRCDVVSAEKRAEELEAEVVGLNVKIENLENNGERDTLA